MAKPIEPRQLKLGKQFHTLIQKEWLAHTEDGTPRVERTIRRLNGRNGRMDILVEEIGDDLLSVVEIKGTDWDRIAPKNVRRNVRRQIRQIWSYVDAVLERYQMYVYPGVIFPKLPKEPSRVVLIEDMFNGDGIQVVWHDETADESRERLEQQRKDT